MDESRIKELAAIAGFGDDPDENYRLNDVLIVLRTVAAEARKEGIEEMVAAVMERWNNYMTKDDIRAVAERLKEQGK